MSSFSPSAFLLWAILACLFEVFLVIHLWMYDKFQCLKWGSGRQPGAFKRVMTYSYLATVPLLMIFSVIMAYLSYQEGWIIIPPPGGIQAQQILPKSPPVTPDPDLLRLYSVVPKPFSLYSHAHERWLLPMYFVLAIGWALELVTHLEELTFWLFLIHQGPTKRDWFHSWEFRTWSLGSMVALLGMPIAVLLRRHNYDTCIAWVLFSGSSAGTVTTIAFIYVLIRFPDFMKRVKAEGAEPDTIVRLMTFYQLNIVRVVFRFLFNFSLLAMALDGIQGPHSLTKANAASDVLSMLGGISCFVSSAITLLVFFPRSITRESGYKAKLSSTPSAENLDGAASPLPHYSQHARDASSPKSQSPGAPQANFPTAFRLANPDGSEYSFTSFSQPQQRPTRTVSNPSHRRYSSEGPGYYESDPEILTHTNGRTPPRRYHSRRQKGDEKIDQIWEMQRAEEMVTAYRRQHHSAEGGDTGFDDPHTQPPPSWDEHQNHEPYKRDDKKNTDSSVMIMPSDGPPITLEEGGSYPSPRSSFVHPYVMNFTSPIDLLDTTDSHHNHDG